MPARPIRTIFHQYLLPESENGRKRCEIGMEIPTPSGYTLQGRWVSAQCTQRLLTSSQMNDCLKGKLIYLLGDSTLRQWIEYFPKVAKSKWLPFYSSRNPSWPYDALMWFPSLPRLLGFLFCCLGLSLYSYILVS